MNAAATNPLPPLLGAAFPPSGVAPMFLPQLAALQAVLDAEIAPKAAENDARGRYPAEAIAALKRTGILASALPKELGGLAAPHHVTLEALVRMAIADSAVAQIFKVHDEILREVLTFCPAALKPRLARKIVEDRSILGLAVAESGRRVDDPMTTTCLKQLDGSFVINGTKIYTTGAAGADLIAVWAFNPAAAPGIAENPILGLQLNFVPAGTPGVTIKRDWDALGQRATDSGTIAFENVRTDPEWNATEPGHFPPLHASLRYQAGFAAIMIGLGIGALRAAVPFIATKSRPWPSAEVATASDDPYVQRLAGELVAELAAAYALTLATGDILDACERGEVDRTAVAIPIYAAKTAATRASLRATSEIFTLMGTRSAARANGFDCYWRNARILSLHDPVEWKYAEIGRHVLTGWDPPWGLYQ